MGSTEKVKAILSEYLVLVIAFIVFLTLLTDKYLNKKMSPAISALINLHVNVPFPSFYFINKTAVNSTTFQSMNNPLLNQ